jgi:hypothetical protein
VAGSWGGRGRKGRVPTLDPNERWWVYVSARERTRQGGQYTSVSRHGGRSYGPRIQPSCSPRVRDIALPSSPSQSGNNRWLGTSRPSAKASPHPSPCSGRLRVIRSRCLAGWVSGVTVRRNLRGGFVARMPKSVCRAYPTFVRMCSTLSLLLSS